MEFGLPPRFSGVPSLVEDILADQSTSRTDSQGRMPPTFSLGRAYDDSMCLNINKYLELDTNDRLCYVGVDEGTLVPLVRHAFVLTEPVTEINLRGGVSIVDRFGSRKHLSVDMSVEEFFKRESTKPAQFTKILLKDSLGYISDWSATVKHIFKTLTISGKILVVHRSSRLNSLPVSPATKVVLNELDQPVDSIIGDMMTCGVDVDVHWGLEQLTCTVPTQHWMTMVSGRFPPPLETSSTFDDEKVRSGLVDLASGIFRYSGEMIEFTDRLVFLTAERKHFGFYLRSPYYKAPVPLSERRYGYTSKIDNIFVNVDTDELEKCVREKVEREKLRQNRKN